MARILVLSHYWAPENGVPQRRWTWLTQVLHDHGYSITVIAPPPHYDREVAFARRLVSIGSRVATKVRGLSRVEDGFSGERIYRTAYLTGGSGLTSKALNQGFVALSTLWTLRHRKTKRKLAKPDIIVGTVPALPTAVVARIGAKILGVPYVIDLRDAWPDLLNYSDDWNSGTGQSSWRERLFNKGLRRAGFSVVSDALNKALDGAAGIIVTSEDLGKQLQWEIPRRTRGKQPNVCTVRNVFPLKSETEKTSVSVDAAGTDRNHLNVLYAGTLGRAQKLGNALEAAALAKKSGVDVHLKLVGAGATKAALQEQAETLDVDVDILPRTDADALDEHYQWADTALVHLADWEPLRRAVPSKTYELMEAGIHICAAVDGETARLVSDLEAGHTVAPENPKELADLWIHLARNKNLLEVSDRAAKWVTEQRLQYAPEVIVNFFDQILSRQATESGK
ncbi:glycosyltransferase family 4 protein [Corynebacterium coyleae]|uniref:glycosyltransferase family 4 protein n=1 Tax=Corynebacterium coyleae TaxID=53374 RepID=UPI001CCEB185|nr:glycosyltransferase family 4 protein [Corynebacterium coyleae]UBI09824.1 glycosyltransferase family 4 protein [Corynebacterium coyleae]